MSAANGNGWSGKLVATLPRGSRALPIMRDAKQLPLPWSSSSTEIVFLTRTDPTRNIDGFMSIDITPTLFGERGAFWLLPPRIADRS
jgi:hypothetical protein